jgi:SagB-type dehydrogenase family enzyme
MIDKKLLKRFKYFQETPAQKFREETTIDEFKKFIPRDKYPKAWIDVNFKGYPRFEKVKLPDTKMLGINYGDLANRHSYRIYSGEAIHINELSTILGWSVGLRYTQEKRDIGNRFYPSAGGRYPVEVYPVVFNVEGLKPGVYHYHLKDYSLEYLWTDKGFPENFFNNFEQVGMVSKASVLLVMTGVFARNEIKYGAKGYRFTYVDCGSITMLISLIVESLGLGSCAIGGFLRKLDRMIGVDGKNESTCLCLTIGRKRQ